MTAELLPTFVAMRDALPEALRPVLLELMADNDRLAAKVSFANDVLAALDRGDWVALAYYRRLYADALPRRTK